MASPSVTKIDIGTEMKAMARGECLACRIGGTHSHNHACDNTPAKEFMSKCNMGHMFKTEWFEKCPLCFPESISDERKKEFPE